MIRFLEWDSNFFEKNIFRVEINPNDILPNQFENIVSELKVNHADGAYVVLSSKNNAWESRLEAAGLKCLDEKVVYSKNLFEVPADFAGGDIEEYHGELDADLRKLSLEAGRYSRFKKDEYLRGRFDDLYIKWMENSVYRKVADHVLVYKIGLRIVGMITVKINFGIATIGLIATEQTMQGKGIGTQLMGKAENIVTSKGVKQMEVATQRANKQACSFYEKCSYSIRSVTPIYHIWI
jgi:dTDP-4-amino-4,6-dideoxy-D-galactose acyltransferase